MHRQEEVETLLGAFAARDIEAIRALGEAGFDLDLPGGAGLTVLMRAILRGHAVTVEWILAAGADPNAAGASGETALDLARGLDRTDLIELLLAAGADGEAIPVSPEPEIEPTISIGHRKEGVRSARTEALWMDRFEDTFDDEINDETLSFRVV